MVDVPNGALTGCGRSVTTSNGYEVSVLSTQVPVTFTVTGRPHQLGDAIYLTGSVAELGHWSTDPRWRSA